MRFDNEELFKELAKTYGINLFLGAGFSVYAYNNYDEKLPLGDDINKRLIKLFSLDNSRNFNLSKTCQKIKINNSDMLEKELKEIYTVKNFDEEYLTITKLPIKNIITINIDNLLEKIYDSPKSSMNLSDTAIYGSLEKEKVVSLYKLHGSVTYPVGSRMSFTETELTDLFIKDSKLFETVSFKLSTAPTIFWGTKLYDNNTMQLICNSEVYSKSPMQKWLVVYPDEKNKTLIEDYVDLGFNIIEADTKELINYLGKQSFAKKDENDKYIYKEYREKFPTSFISNELKKSGVKRPVVDFFAGAEPIISDIVSNNVSRTSYYTTLLETILKGNITLITGIPGCGKSTLLMQLAFSDELSGRKFWFNNIIKQEAEKLVNLVKEDDNVTVFIDNLYSNVDALNVLKEAKNIKLVLAERALNYEYVKRFLSISSDRIVDISDLNKNDVQMICKSMNRSSSDAFDLMSQNENISLLEIVFYTATSTQIQERIKSYVKDLKEYNDKNLKIDLLELFALVNYTSYCGIPCSMDMMYFYFSDYIESYEDILYALEKMNRIIVESTEYNFLDKTQDYKEIRSKLFAEKSFGVLDSNIISDVMNKFLDKVGTHIIYRYDIFKRRAYDADLTKKAFDLKEGIEFYEKVLKNNKSPYVRHQYALFLQRKGEYNLAWKQIDQAYTESKKKIFSIANTHAIIMFEMNIVNEARSEQELSMLKKTIEKSFLTLEFCITQDVRVNYHILTYARNAIRYYEKYSWDSYAEQYVNSALNQLAILLNSGEYIYQGTLRELKNLQKQLVDIKKIE
ncbi:MAG: SIR2 family protein [Lachnospiraceae bacterium]